MQGTRVATHFMISALLSSAAFLPLSGTPPAPNPLVTSLPAEKERRKEREKQRESEKERFKGAEL